MMGGIEKILCCFVAIAGFVSDILYIYIYNIYIIHKVFAKMADKFVPFELDILCYHHGN